MAVFQIQLKVNEMAHLICFCKTVLSITSDLIWKLPRKNTVKWTQTLFFKV